MLTAQFDVMLSMDPFEPASLGAVTTAELTISLTGAMPEDPACSVDWSTEDVGQAVAGIDYEAASGTVTLSYWSISASIEISILYDQEAELPEEFRVVLSNPTGGALISSGTAIVRIQDNSLPPEVQFEAMSGTQVAEGDSLDIQVYRNQTVGSLTVYYVIADDSVATSSDVTITPQGSVTFADGESAVILHLEAVDDSLIEVKEKLLLELVAQPAPNNGPVPYVIGGNGTAEIWIRDNNEVVISDLTVAWQKPDETWQASPDNEMLWQDDDLRWTVTLPPEEVPFLEELTLMHRNHDYPTGDWTPVVSQMLEADPNDPTKFYIYANLMVGDWDITVRGVFAFDVIGWLAAPKHRAADAIASTIWIIPSYDPLLRLEYHSDEPYPNPLYFGPRIYPEYTLPPDHVPGQSDHTWVDVQVTLAMAPPAGFDTKVYMKSFDPDHAYNPPTWFEDYTLDPNDWHYTADNTFHPKGDDNRFGSVVTGNGGFLLNDQISFNAGQTTATNPFKIVAIQPGNNFSVGVTIHPDGVSPMELGPDAVTIVGPWMTPSKMTEVLTVWRTLHIERDSMGEPHSGDTFDADPQGMDDPPPNPWDVRDADISLLADSFHPANIYVIADLAAC